MNLKLEKVFLYETNSQTQKIKNEEVFSFAIINECRKTILTLLSHFEPISEAKSLSSIFDLASKSTPLAIAGSDQLHFGLLWPILRKLHNEGSLLSIIQQRRIDIQQQKEHWRPFIEEQIASQPEFYGRILTTLSEGRIEAIQTGYGGAYFLYDKQGKPAFVIKIVDEDILTLNNKKLHGGALLERNYRVRPNIPLYRSAQTDAFTYECAKMMNIEQITSKTVMAIIENPIFYDLSEQLEGAEKEEFLLATGPASKEKLCSIQEFIPDAQEVTELVHQWISSRKTLDDIEHIFDPNDYEDLCILLWAAYETDGHAGNCLAFLKSIDDQGNKIHGLRKIDHGLCFPETNAFFRNYLIELPNSKHKLSFRAKKLIEAIPLLDIVEKMKIYEMEACIPAFEERIGILKKLASREDLTLYDIDLRLRLLPLPFGKDFALGNLSREVLERLLSNEEDNEYFSFEGSS